MVKRGRKKIINLPTINDVINKPVAAPVVNTLKHGDFTFTQEVSPPNSERSVEASSDAEASDTEEELVESPVEESIELTEEQKKQAAIDFQNSLKNQFFNENQLNLTTPEVIKPLPSFKPPKELNSVSIAKADTVQEFNSNLRDFIASRNGDSRTPHSYSTNRVAVSSVPTEQVQFVKPRITSRNNKVSSGRINSLPTSRSNSSLSSHR